MARRSRRVIPLLVAICLLMTVSLSPLVESTDAAWIDEEHAGASFEATTLETPVITACEVETALELGIIRVFTGFTITWTSKYGPAENRLSVDDVPIPPSEITVIGNSPFIYNATIDRSLLENLLDGVLGNSHSLEVEATMGEFWRSTAATRTLSIRLLGMVLPGGNTCTEP